MSDISIDSQQTAEQSPGWLDRAFDALKRRQQAVIVLVVAAQVTILVGMVALEMTPLLTGKTVLLRTRPVDPRDMMRGDYVILSYEFNRPGSGALPGLPRSRYGTRNEWAGRTVYVTLVEEKDGKHWRADKYSLTRPTGGLFLRGKVKRYNQLAFGIEAYFVQEGLGLEYEKARNRRRLTAEVAVAPSGKAKLRGLIIEEPEPAKESPSGS